jgi:hypothetical protein
MNRGKALETIVVLSLASLIAYLKFDLNWLLYVSISLLLLSLVSKKFTIMVGKGWHSFSCFFGTIMNYIILFLIFYFFLIPLSFFQRLTGKNQILKKKSNETHFYHRNHLFTKKDIENPW